jgi:hypothetical protein
MALFRSLRERKRVARAWAGDYHIVGLRFSPENQAYRRFGLIPLIDFPWLAPRLLLLLLERRSARSR